MSLVMTNLATAPAEPAASHTYTLPIVRELPRPAPSGSGGW
jgi:hypothetical protein